MHVSVIVKLASPSVNDRTRIKVAHVIVEIVYVIHLKIEISHGIHDI